MWFFGIGVLAVLLKLAGVVPLAHLHWWWMTVPFILAVAWWAFSDYSGITHRRAMMHERERAAERREKQYEALGMRSPRSSSRKPGKP